MTRPNSCGTAARLKPSAVPDLTSFTGVDTLLQSERIAPAIGDVDCGPLLLDSGDVLSTVQLRYERSGPEDAPAILICHALTGNHLTIGTDDVPGWWSGLAGPGKPIDTETFQVITFNVLGGCSGSTGPASIDPSSGVPYRTAFPAITIRDMVRAQHQALVKLGIRKLAAVVGGSLGGMQALEWGLLYPEMMEKLIVLAATPQLSDYGIGFNHIARRAITEDERWNDGQYETGTAIRGFDLARMIGMVTYRSPALFSSRFQRRHHNTQFEVNGYLNYQGEKLRKRFDPASYVCLLNAMDQHDIGRGRGGIEHAAHAYKCPILLISYERDLVYESDVIANFSEMIPRAVHAHVPTEYGHDGFLTEFEKWGHLLSTFLNT